MFHIAQVNIAPMRAPLTDPVMTDFVANLKPINALADAAPGFVWRLQGEEDNATAFRVFENEMIIINMSVWQTLDALYDYVYRSGHVDVFRRRREWFEKMTTPHMALWYVEAGTTPTPADARQRLEYLSRHGVTPFAFTFKQRFSPQDWLAYQTEMQTA